MKKNNITTFILFKYLTKDMLKYFLFALFFFIILIFFIDIVELFRRSSNKVGVAHLIKANFVDIIGMASLKIPGNIEKTIPFSALIGSISCFNQWRKKNYYINSSLFGISLWGTISPILISFFLIGILSISLLNPISSMFNKKFNQLQTIFFGSKNLKTFSFDTKGFWIKETSGENQLIINAKKINEKNKMLYDINIFVVDKNKTIKERLTAVTGQFNKNIINLYEVESTNRNTRTKKIEKYSLPIKFNSDDLDVTIVHPDTIYILDLPKYILSMKEYGLNTSKHLLHLYKLICQPFLVIAMVLLSASLMLKSNERKMQFGIISISLVTGFSLYFIGDIVFALGSSERLPSLLSGFGPTFIGLFSGCFLVSNIDGPKKITYRINFD